MKKYILVVFWLFIFCVILSSCNKQVSNTPKDNAKPDYSDPASWITSFETTKEVDVFYVYPTVSSNGSGNMDITNKNEQALAKGIFDAQASVFKGNANVYAPYYRQMSTGAKIPDDPNALATDLDEFKKAAGDVQDAFNYYINNLNNGRPFIIAGHSQGTMALIELIKKEFGNSEDLRKRLVAAYLIGYTVTDEDLALSGLTAAQGES
ncbi:MAG: DNA ecombination protein RadA, partial [Firmicutes bacterium HGW-Firmicutes-12]